MIGQWTRYLSANAAAWGLPRGEDWKALLHNNYQPHCSTFNLLWFHQNDSYPRVVAKICRQQEMLIREFNNLEMMYPLAPNYVPKPLHIHELDGFWILWMTGVPGTRIPRRSTYSIPVLRSIVNMIALLHRSAKGAHAEVHTDRHTRFVLKPLEAVMQFADSKIVRDGCTAVSRVASTSWINALPVIPQHGDLYIDNVLNHKNEWHIVDWETFGDIDLPFYDLLTLLLSMLRASGETPAQFNPELVRQVPILLDYYARELGLPLSLVPTLLPLTLANWFYLHWLERRQVAMDAMYRAIEEYFRHKDIWDGIFVPNAAAEVTVA